MPSDKTSSALLHIDKRNKNSMGFSMFLQISYIFLNKEKTWGLIPGVEIFQTVQVHFAEEVYVYEIVPTGQYVIG